MSTRKQQLNELIKDKDFRREFVSDYVQEILAAQIKELREHRQWTQQELGDAAESMKQVQVSRLENPDYSGATINSLKRLANAFDLGLVVSFVRFSEFLDRVTEQSPLSLVPPSYDEEQQQMSFAVSMAPTGEPRFVTLAPTISMVPSSTGNDDILYVDGVSVSITEMTAPVGSVETLTASIASLKASLTEELPEFTWAAVAARPIESIEAQQGRREFALAA